jgi:COP9 signalosome complex subunit 7
MESEAKIQQYLLLGKGAKGRAAVDMIHKATSEPGLYAFGEILDLESIKQVCAEWFSLPVMRARQLNR